MTRPTKTTGAYWYDQTKECADRAARLEDALAESERVRRQLAEATKRLLAYTGTIESWYAAQAAVRSYLSPLPSDAQELGVVVRSALAVSDALDGEGS